MIVFDVFASVLGLAGAVLALTAAIGVVRFPDTLARMHSATKPQVLGLILVLVAALIRLRGSHDAGMVTVSIIFTLITAPVVAHRVGRLAYQEQDMTEVLSIDQLVELTEEEDQASR
ncbi:monovalent cation/H(+) antiporter subunit G [Mycolicibacter senuensis]|uniref:Na+/H+ antiporter subunit G n=1 Tax=Mycolicibacter senuensis TaxID=386913 RepID=A0A7I9XMF7_9MYCO|nr:monovalent cation/H(+) antiporter subunit G [Mycolicibacter senuensis]MDQ2629047.1 monovalent cation/H(+) antiporter subunit G [Actinomycetota bacterium]ORW68881.1 cation:proton antiporter [Mycolicibacter senuensis]GFG70626.1 Na+/H+ antiporter subunit G [Mycolicibacter senuensis]